MVIKTTRQKFAHVRSLFVRYFSNQKINCFVIFGAISMPAFGQSDLHAINGAKVTDIDEIIITASKRQQSFQDFAGSVSVISTKNDNQALTIESIAQQVPGFSLVETGPRNPTSFVIRGLRTDSVGSNDFGGDGGTVASYVDNIPLQGYFVPPNFSLKDLQQIEVLRGPQGTLYGNSSIGGLIRYVTAKPDLTKNSVTVNASVSQTKESDDLNSDTDLIANLPIIADKLGVRLLLGKQHNAGFIDDPYLLSGPAKDINDDETKQARISALWKLTEKFSLSGSYHYQKNNVDDRQATNESFTGDEYTSSNKYLQPMQGELKLAGIDADYQFDFATLTASVNRYDYKNYQRADQTDYLLTIDSFYDLGFANYPEFSGYTTGDINVKKDSTELRLVSRDDQPLRWLVGAFYSKDDVALTLTDTVPGFQEFSGENRPGDLDYYASQNELLKENSLYTEIAYDIKPEWEILVGARYSTLTDDLGVCTEYFPIEDGDTADCLNGKDDQSNTLKKLSTKYKITDNNSVYLTVSEGFRRGGANPLPIEVDNNRYYKPDTSTNYELGTHSYFFAQKLQFSGAIFYIDWNDVQVSTYIDDTYSGYVNAKAARSQGVELEAKFSASDNWSFHSGFSYTEAELNENIENINGGGENAYKGDRLPGSPRYQINLGINYNQQIRTAQLTAGLEIARNGDSYSALNNEFSDYAQLPAYTTANTHIDVSLRNWRAGIFVNNITNERGVTGRRTAGLFGEAGQFEYITRPRTLGVSASYHF